MIQWTTVSNFSFFGMKGAQVINFASSLKRAIPVSSHSRFNFRLSHSSFSSSSNKPSFSIGDSLKPIQKGSSKSGTPLQTSKIEPVPPLREVGDPWDTLYHFPPSSSSTNPSTTYVPQSIIPPLARVNESPLSKRKRLLYSSRHRGILETDLILSTFASKYLFPIVSSSSSPSSSSSSSAPSSSTYTSSKITSTSSASAPPTYHDNLVHGSQSNPTLSDLNTTISSLTLTDAQVSEFETILDENDWDIYYWSTGGRPAPSHISQLSIWKRIVDHALNKDKVVVRMPSLE